VQNNAVHPSSRKDWLGLGRECTLVHAAVYECHSMRSNKIGEETGERDEMPAAEGDLLILDEAHNCAPSGVGPFRAKIRDARAAGLRPSEKRGT
jgi:hypothetical protein